MIKKLGKTVRYTNDILRGVNVTLWGGGENSKKIGKAVTTGISGVDIVIGTSHALEEFACNDPICGMIDVIGSVSSTLGLILGNISVTKKYTIYTTAVTVESFSDIQITYYIT